MCRKSLSMLVLCVAVLAGNQAAQAGSCGHDGQCGCVTKTIMVPKLVPEYRTVTVTECVPEMRERTRTVCRTIPVTTIVERQCEVIVPRTAYRDEKFCVSKPIWKYETHECTVTVPYIEMVEKTHTVCKQIPTIVKKTVCVDEGHWEKQCSDCCHKCARCVWVPKKVQKEIECTVMKSVQVEETYRCPVQRCREVKQSNTTRCLVGFEKEQKVRQVPYTVCVPVMKQRNYPVTTCQEVKEDVVEKYCVMVPRTVEKQCCKWVCKMVPQTVTVPVNSWCDACTTCVRRACRHCCGN